MKIMPVNNINTQTQFKAKFRQRDVKEFLREMIEPDVDTIPKLYTMLDYIRYYPGKKAEIKHIGLWHKILIDGKSMNNDAKYFTAFHALQDAVVTLKNSLLKDAPMQRMSEEEFENAYCKNSKKTAKDIENLFKE